MNRHRSLTRQLGLLAVLLLTSVAAIPQQPGNRYTVEIVVFRNGGQGAALDATFAPSTSGDDVEPTVIATRKLGTAASRLRAASGMRVLAHTAWTQTASGLSSRRGVSAANLGLAAAGISGKVMLLRGSYLNLGIDLTIDDGGRKYHIAELRNNIKADQIQYFDHPAVGVLAVVSAGG
jgi:hypothetical protein